MSHRMIRALERGGCAIRRSDGNWDVKRTHDARGTSIGQLDGENVATLRCEGQLKRFGDYDPVRLVWAHGDRHSATPQRFPSKALAFAQTSGQTESLFERCLQGMRCDKTRKHLFRAIAAYREDIQWAANAGSVSGMNWRGLALGTRISGTHAPDRSLSNRYAGGAGRRLQQIAERFGVDALRELNSLVLDDVSRNRFSETFDVSRRRVEARAMTHLELLAQIYDNDLVRPESIVE